MNNEDGFTLLELLIVLMIVSTVFLFVIPAMGKTVMKHNRDQFFEQLLSDIFYAQNQVLNREKAGIIHIYPDYYFFDLSDEKRTVWYPEDLRNEFRLTTISFLTKGAIKNPDSYLFRTDNVRYRLTFPFGKGRGYIVEM